DLDTICLRCVEKDPARRYPSAQQLARDLQLFLAGKPVEPLPMSLYRRAILIARREPVIAAVVGGLLVFFFLLMVVEHLKYGRAAQAKAHTELAIAQADERARQASRDAEQASKAKALAERETAAARAANQAAIADLAKARDGEKVARE